MNSPHDKHATPLALDVLQQFRLIFGSMRQYFRLVEERCGMPGSQMWVLQEVARTRLVIAATHDPALIAEATSPVVMA